MSAGEPTPAALVERVVACLAEPTAEPDVTVGQAVWRLYGALSDVWASLSLEPMGGGHEAFDAVYEATGQGLQVRDPPSEGSPLGTEPAWRVPVEFAGEVVALFTIRPRPRASPSTAWPLRDAAPAIGLLLVDLAQRRRMRRELSHLRALARLNAGLWAHRETRALLEAAVAGLRDAWGVERVRLFRRDPAGPWPLVAEATLPGALAGTMRALEGDALFEAERATGPGLSAIAPNAWVAAVTDQGPPHGALLLDNAITASPLDRVDDLTETVRALAAAWARLPESADVTAAPPGRNAAAAISSLEALASEVGPSRPGCLVVWGVFGYAQRLRRRERAPADEPRRLLERWVVPRHRFASIAPDTFASLVTAPSVEIGREVAEGGMDLLVGVWRAAAAVVPSLGRTPAVWAGRTLDLLSQAAALHEGSVLAEGDRWRSAPDGGLVLAPGAVLRPAALRLDLANAAVPLTRTEVRILRALATADHPLPAGDLVRRVWPGDRTMGVMNLYPHVHELRRRLTAAWPAGLRVRTVRGQGYALMPEGPTAGAG